MKVSADESATAKNVYREGNAETTQRKDPFYTNARHSTTAKTNVSKRASQKNIYGTSFSSESRVGIAFTNHDQTTELNLGRSVHAHTLDANTGCTWYTEQGTCMGRSGSSPCIHFTC